VLTRIWDEVVSKEDLAIYAAAGYGNRSAWGDHPALLVVDVNYNFVGDRSEPVLKSIERFPNSCGEAGWDAVGHIGRLLESARATAIPVFYTTQPAVSDATTAGAWARKNSRFLSGAVDPKFRGVDIVKDIEPVPGEIVMLKDKPSAFFGTPLVSYLNELRIDTTIVVGGTTSGCVRATVVDAFSYNYRVVVVEEGCFDRGRASHAVNLFDIHSKYGDVVSVAEAIEYMRGLPVRG
jgi:maleamate amidohydrolase